MVGKTRANGVGVARDLALVAMIAWLTAGPAAQGLAEVARRSAGRGPAAPGRAYTNADVEPARPAQPVTAPVSSEPVAPVENGSDGEPGKAAMAPVATAPVTPTPGPLTAEAKAQQEARAAHARKLGDELGARLQQRQERVQGLKKELQELQQAHAAGKPTATVAARNALQQSLSDAEREVASAQRAVSRAEAQTKPATAGTAPPPQP